MPDATTTDLALTLGDVIDGARSDWLDFVAQRRSDISAALLETEPGRVTFYDLTDRWRFVAAHIASALATPLGTVLAMTIAAGLRWHEQAIRIDGGQFEDLPPRNKEQSA